MIHCVLVWFLKPVPLSENAGTLNQQLEACRSMPQRAKIFLGTVGATHPQVKPGECQTPKKLPQLPGGELFSTVQNRYGQISYSYLVPNISFNFKDAICQTVCTTQFPCAKKKKSAAN